LELHLKNTACEGRLQGTHIHTNRNNQVAGHRAAWNKIKIVTEDILPILVGRSYRKWGISIKLQAWRMTTYETVILTK
jgi:hypothetical protein